MITRQRIFVGLVVLAAACNGTVAGDDAGDSGGSSDGTITDGMANDAMADAGADVLDAQTQDSAKEAAAQCAYSIGQTNDAGICHTSAGDVNCSAQDPTFDRCVGAELHATDGGSFGSVECFDSDADNGTIVCCNGTNSSGVTLLFASSWTCCPGAAPDGGTAACDPDAGQACVETDGGWTCQ